MTEPGLKGHDHGIAYMALDAKKYGYGDLRLLMSIWTSLGLVMRKTVCEISISRKVRHTACQDSENLYHKGLIAANETVSVKTATCCCSCL